MEEIIESIINGQRKQAVEQLKESPYTFSDLLEKLEDLKLHDESVKMYRVALSQKYIKEGK